MSIVDIQKQLYHFFLLNLNMILSTLTHFLRYTLSIAFAHSEKKTLAYILKQCAISNIVEYESRVRSPGLQVLALQYCQCNDGKTTITTTPTTTKKLGKVDTKDLKNRVKVAGPMNL